MVNLNKLLSNVDHDELLNLFLDNNSSVIFMIDNLNDQLNTQIEYIYNDLSKLGFDNVFCLNDLLDHLDKKSEIAGILGLDMYLSNLYFNLSSKHKSLSQYIPLKVKNETKIYNLKAVRNHKKNHAIFILNVLDSALFNIEELYYSSYKDKLTGLFNRNTLDLHLSVDKDEHYIGFFDLDGFKIINDTLTHQGGDELLKLIGEKLISIANENVIFYRTGGDEFVLITIGLDKPGVEELVESVKNELLKIKFKGIIPKFSFGVCHYTPGCGYTPTDALNVADIGMYKSKLKGKNQITFISDENAARIMKEDASGVLNYYRMIHCREA